MTSWHTAPAIATTPIETVAQIAREHGMTAADLIGPSRLRRVCIVGWRAMKALRDKGRSLSSIGRILNRDHTTILHGLRRAG